MIPTIGIQIPHRWFVFKTEFYNEKVQKNLEQGHSKAGIRNDTAYLSNPAVFEK